MLAAASDAKEESGSPARNEGDEGREDAELVPSPSFHASPNPIPPDTFSSPASSLCILALLGPLTLGIAAWLLVAALSGARWAPHPGGSWESSQGRKDKRLDRRGGSQQRPEVTGLSLLAGLAEAPTPQLCSGGRPGGLLAQKLARVPFSGAPTLPSAWGFYSGTASAPGPRLPAEDWDLYWNLV